jgi:hypothetical protein
MKQILLLIAILLAGLIQAQEYHGDMTRVAGWTWKVVQDGEVLSMEELKLRMSEVDGAYELWRKGNKQYYRGAIVTGLGLGLFAIGFVSSVSNSYGGNSEVQSLGWMLMGSGFAVYALGGIPLSKGNINMERAVSKYNFENSKSKASLDIGMGQYGLGLTLRF